MTEQVNGEMAEPSEDIDFCTLGMFIVDEIHFQPPTPPVVDILGGAGSYSALGARIFSPAISSTSPSLSSSSSSSSSLGQQLQGRQQKDLAHSVGWVVDAGSDFPDVLREEVKSWGTSCLFREDKTRRTTRGWNGYGEHEERAFKYLTPKLRLDHESLTPDLLLARSFHLICSPGRCIELVKGILSKRTTLQSPRANDRPLFIWEPVPNLCTPEELAACYDAIKHVDIISPNHGELCAFFGEKAHHDDTGEAAIETIVACTARLLQKGVGGDGMGAVVVRVGKDGCYVATRTTSRWLPAYHQQGTTKVVDPTGGGNTFLGGLAVGLVRGQASPGVTHAEEAALWGSVAASFAIEQVGMPRLNRSDNEDETWNGERALDRLEALKSRLAIYTQPS